jgi:hypothetical protein
MRQLVVALVVASGCAPSGLYARAQARLGASPKHVQLAGYERIAGDDVYVFCRHETKSWPGSPRTYDGRCVIYVCPGGVQCREP